MHTHTLVRVHPRQREKMQRRRRRKVSKCLLDNFGHFVEWRQTHLIVGRSTLTAQRSHLKNGMQISQASFFRRLCRKTKPSQFFSVHFTSFAVVFSYVLHHHHRILIYYNIKHQVNNTKKLFSVLFWGRKSKKGL